MARKRRSAADNVVGVSIRKARLARGFTQAQLAEAVEITVESLSRAETGAILPTVETLGRIATVLDLTLDALVGRDQSLMAADSCADSPEHRRLKRHIDALPLSTVRKLLALVELLPHE
jgi:transcriptional regulator with XRE-family HTH domain